MKTILTWILIFFGFSSSSQSNGELIEKSLDIKIPFTITQYSTKSGLPQSRVIDIVSKANGNLIISTANGIVEYDGSEFTNFITDETYKNSYYHKILWNDKTNQLFGFTDAFKIQLIYPVFKHLEQFNCIHIRQDTLYAMDTIGDMYYSILPELNFKKVVSTKITGSRSIYVSSNHILIGSKDGLFQFFSNSNKTKQLASGNFFEIKQNQFNDKVYALSVKAAYEIDGDTLKQVLSTEKYESSMILQDIEFVSNGEIYVSSTKGLIEIGDGYIDRYTKISALPSLYLQPLLFSSSENCLFVGTGEKGLLKLQFKNCYSFTSNEGFSETSSLSSIVRTNGGKVTVVDDKGTLYQLGIDTAIFLLELKTVCRSLATVDKDLYVGTLTKGVLVIRDKTVVDSITFPVQLPHSNVLGVYKDRAGYIWIGTNNGIASGTNSKNIRPFKSNEIKGKIICFYELKNKSICIGGNDGAFILSSDHQKVIHLGRQAGLMGKNVRSFYEDAEGKLWIGTYDGGLYCYYKGNLKNINLLKNAKLDKDAFCLAKDDYDFIYMTSNHGLWRVSEKNLSDFYYGRLDYLIPFYYGEETGIVNTEFNGGFQNNFLKTRTNHFYFPSIEGLVLVDPEEPTFRKLNPKMNKVEVNDTVFDAQIHRFNKKTYSVAFYFSCLNYLKKYNVYFQYKLETRDKKSDWSTLQKETSITFKMLPAGHYTFIVRALDAFNDPQPNEISCEFEIEPIFYETFWFKTFAFFGIIALASIIIRIRISMFRKKAAEKERFRRQLAEFELKATHAQMNPHFIFNSLNSIKYYLSINDKKNADNYIDHFSNLLRSFLENGSKDFIELKDEIEILKSYLELEQQRMSPAFTYSIKVNQSLNQFLIPTHLIQPFVENAIKHGINHSSKQCHLVIYFYVQNQNLICVIDDDGIGRNRSAEINKQRRSHNSKGLEMVLEKIRIVKEIYKLEILLNIEDKLAPDMTSLGTRVEIQIPIPSNEDTNS